MPPGTSAERVGTGEVPDGATVGAVLPPEGNARPNSAVDEPVEASPDTDTPSIVPGDDAPEACPEAR